MSAYNDEDQDNHESAEADDNFTLGHVYRHWWNKDQVFRAFRIGFQGNDFIIQDGGGDGAVRLPIDQLDNFIDGTRGQ
jgi:hypothetical protein